MGAADWRVSDRASRTADAGGWCAYFVAHHHKREQAPPEASISESGSGRRAGYFSEPLPGAARAGASEAPRGIALWALIEQYGERSGGRVPADELERYSPRTGESATGTGAHPARADRVPRTAGRRLRTNRLANGSRRPRDEEERCVAAQVGEASWLVATETAAARAVRLCGRVGLSRFDLRKALPQGWAATRVRGRHVCCAARPRLGSGQRGDVVRQLRSSELSRADHEACMHCAAHYRCTACGDVIHLARPIRSPGWSGPTTADVHRLVLGDPPRCWECRRRAAPAASDRVADAAAPPRSSARTETAGGTSAQPRPR